MTYERIKNLTNGYLFGDKKIPDDSSMMISALFQSALEEVAMTGKVYSLHMTEEEAIEENREIICILPTDESKVIVRPILPIDDKDDIDIDEGLTYAIARLVASYLASTIELKQYHASKANQIITLHSNSTFEYNEE